MYCEKCGLTFNEDTKFCPRCKNPIPVNQQRLHTTQEDGAIDKWRELDTIPIEEDDDSKFSKMLNKVNKHSIAAVAIRVIVYIVIGAI